MNDVADALTACMTRSGQGAATGNMDMGGFEIINVGNATTSDSAVNVTQVQNNAFTWCGTAGGTANALTLSAPIPITSYVAGQAFTFKSGASANTSTVTVAINGLATKAIQSGGVALAADDIGASQWYRITYDGAAFQLEQIALSAGGSFTFTNITVTGSATINDATLTGDVDMSTADSVDYLNGSITIDDLAPSLVNQILGGGGGGFGGSLITSGDGRLSLATGVKVMTQDYAAQGTVYYVGGVILNFNDGSGTFQPFNTGELSQTLASSTYSPAAGAAAKNYDMFAWKRAIVVASVTRSGTTATVTTTGNHNITTGAIVYIAAADQSAYNGYQTLTGGSATTFTFEVAGSPTTPATGSITCHTATLSRGPFWSSDTARGTGAGTTQITLVGSTYTNTVDITNGPGAGLGTYVGSIMTDGGGATVTWKLGTAAAAGGEAWLGVWNVSNRTFTGTAIQDTTATWTTTTLGFTFARMNVSSTWRCTMICGLNDSIVQSVIYSQVFPPAGGNAAGVGVGLDSITTAASRANVTTSGGLSAETANFAVQSSWNGFTGLGKHYLQGLQATNLASGTCTYYGTNSGFAQSTMYTYSYQ